MSKYRYRATMIGGATVRFCTDKKPRQIIDERNRILMTDDTVINLDHLSYILIEEAKDEQSNNA